MVLLGPNELTPDKVRMYGISNQSVNDSFLMMMWDIQLILAMIYSQNF